MVIFACPYTPDHGPEPGATINHRSVWELARYQLLISPPNYQDFLTPLFDMVESGWRYVRILQFLFEYHEKRYSSGPVAEALIFVQMDVVDPYRTLAYHCRAMLDDPETTIDDVDGEASRFDRNLRVLRLVCSDSVIPADFREAVFSVADAMEGWYAKVSAHLERAEEFGPPFWIDPEERSER